MLTVSPRGAVPIRNPAVVQLDHELRRPRQVRIENEMRVQVADGCSVQWHGPLFSGGSGHPEAAWPSGP